MIFLWGGILLKLMEIGGLDVLQILYSKDVAGIDLLTEDAINEIGI
jgi:hypothetical protein